MASISSKLSSLALQPYPNLSMIHSSIPTEYTIQLKLPTVNQSVTVSAANTLIDPDQAGSVSQIGATFIQNRLSSIPGRSLQDLVNSQPGWLYEGNAVLHPRGSEYQTQFVVDGIPLTDNRSPSFGPEIEADDVQSMSIYTAGIPAEYGRKMGGVVEVNTLQDSQHGFHGQVVLSGGSFDSAGAFAEGQYVWGKNTLGGSASGSMTDHYLNPVVPQNYSNTGTLGDFSVHYQRDSDAERSPEPDRSSRDRTLRYSERTCAASRRAAPNGGQHRDDGNRLVSSHFFVHMSWRIFTGWFATTRMISIPTRIQLPSRCFSTTGFARDISRASVPSIMGGTNGNSESSPTIYF